ncbi:hypothetical protein GNI_071400 [Gregarina niphandrodes]|uniref:Uncharacterized protein n=1 Tax=Gregarina niphandrodes TaxID=110365 RepID=A0A023B7E4_GRENI|nr:hypothetical protein GNI_071400 [Gregarina niphandrodes]EZG67125.1 hypothetical protein GNI_071400 [Gregarina niphandrodes]|eukprot:XP_011130327.1 hypothetical protein GNI_071400 [Gregarina niphandrodes]
MITTSVAILTLIRTLLPPGSLGRGLAGRLLACDRGDPVTALTTATITLILTVALTSTYAAWLVSQVVNRGDTDFEDSFLQFNDEAPIRLHQMVEAEEPSSSSESEEEVTDPGERSRKRRAPLALPVAKRPNLTSIREFFSTLSKRRDRYTLYTREAGFRAVLTALSTFRFISALVITLSEDESSESATAGTPTNELPMRRELPPRPPPPKHLLCTRLLSGSPLKPLVTSTIRRSNQPQPQ